MLDRIRRQARPLARIGCASIGTVYVLVGSLALLALAGILTGSADEDRMVYVVLGIPGGAVLIWTIVGGLAGYVVWRTAEAVTDPYGCGTDPRGMAVRLGVAASALTYGVLAWSAARIAMGAGSGGGDASEQQQERLIARVLDWPGGSWLVAAAGVAVVITALVQVVLVYRAGYARRICLADRPPAMQRVIRLLAWYGYVARGVILGVLGYFVLRAAATRNAAAVGDTDTAFDFIGGGVVGDSAFFVVAVGTLAYGLFMYLNARYYKFEPRDGRP